jgi:putative endonuclease
MYVYILLCADGSYYVGVTNDIEKRVAEHNNGKDPKAYTYRKTPVKLVWHESFINPSEAIELEKQLKGWSQKKEGGFN